MTQFGLGSPFYFPPSSVPVLSTIQLSDDEQRTVGLLQSRASLCLGEMLLCDLYYRGMQVVKDLGIAIPPELRGLRTLVGVPTLGVDPIVERSALDGFRMGDQTDADPDLTDIFDLNGWDGEQSLAFTDTKVFGRSYVTVGAPDEPGDVPQICVESPLNVSVLWDLQSKEPRAALQSYWMDQTRNAALMLPDQTISMAQNDYGKWVITNRDPHNFGAVPIRRLANRPRSNNRDGFSAITPQLQSITDGMCRTMLGLEVSREFYSVPKMLILGATEASFQNADGTRKTAWDTYISRMLAMERDEEGQLPTVQQLKAYDPAVFTKIIDMYSAQAAGILGVPAQYVGLYTQGNPVSAEAAQVSEARLDRQARRDMGSWSGAMRDIARFALRFANNGTLPKDAERLHVDWMDPSLPNFTGMADGLSKLMSEGAVPRRSDVILRRLGFNALDRLRMAKDRDPVEEVIDEIGSSVEAKAIRAANALSKAGGTDVPPVVVPPATPLISLASRA